MKRWVKISVWSLFVLGVVFLMYSTQKTWGEKKSMEPKIRIRVDGDTSFLTEDEVLELLDRKNLWNETIRIQDLDISSIEAELKKHTHVKHVRVYQDVKGEWEIDLDMRTPIARIFNKHGESFYLDEDGETMKKSPTHVARNLVVTGEIPDRLGQNSVDEIINNDSLISIRKLDEIYRISNYVCNDPLLRSLIGQLHLEKSGDFVLVPIVGNQTIVFGTASSDELVSRKFEKLKIFYKEAMPYEGWDKYTKISLKYEDQIVCKKKKTDG